MSFHPYQKIDSSKLIGQKFKRKKYGLSSWTDTISEVSIVLEYNSEFKEYCPKCKIQGTLHQYDLDEIIIWNVDREYRDGLGKQLSEAYKSFLKRNSQTS